MHLQGPMGRSVLALKANLAMGPLCSRVDMWRPAGGFCDYAISTHSGHSHSPSLLSIQKETAWGPQSRKLTHDNNAGCLVTTLASRLGYLRRSATRGLDRRTRGPGIWCRCCWRGGNAEDGGLLCSLGRNYACNIGMALYFNAMHPDISER